MSTQQIIDGWEHGHEPYECVFIPSENVLKCYQCGRTQKEHYKAKLDKRRKVYCARCGEESGGRGTSFWAHVHKWGPTTHKFKPTNTVPR